MFLFSFLLIFKSSYSQNVGIGTTNPQSGLDINADLALRSTDIIINSVYSYSLDVNSLKQTNYKLKSPTLPVGNFIIAGISGSVEGRIITLTNRSGFSMEIYNEDLTASASDRIQTGTGSTIAVYNGGAITLQYDGTDQRWSVKSMHNNSLDYFGGGGGGSSYWDLSGNNITNNNPGNVGIGTSGPTFKLDVNGNIRSKGNGITGNGLTGGALTVWTNDLPGTQYQYLNIDGQKIQSLGSPNISTVPSAKDLFINPFGGKIGIGFTTPASKLSVLSTTVAGNNNTDVFQILGKNPVMWVSDAAGTNHGYLKGVTDNTLTPQFPGAGLEIGAVPGTDLFLSANYAPVLTIAQNNNVGIGTTIPSHKLSVNGIIRSKEVVVESANWPDYVFTNQYSLKPLDEVEQFIKQNKHLPNIPSASEIEKNGLELGAVQNKMMEKIEELTLYIIELKKEMKALQQQIISAEIKK